MSDPAVAERALPRWAQPLAVPDFRRLWLVGYVVFMVRWLEMLAMAVFAYERTGSAFIVALITLLRPLPMGLFGAFIGALADRYDRRISQMFVLAAMMACSMILAILAYTNTLEIWHLCVAAFVNGTAWAADNPIRRVMLSEAVGPERIGAAMSIDVGSGHAGRIFGPALGGAVLGWVGIQWAFGVSILFYLVAFAAVWRVTYRNRAVTTEHPPFLKQMIEGIAIARREPRLAGVLLVTILFNIFLWPYTSMVPVIGQGDLHLDAASVGVLASMDEIGATLGAIIIGVIARPEWFTRIYIVGSLVCIVFVIAFSLAPDPFSAGMLLVLVGFGSAGFSVMQSTLTYLFTPPEMRSRIFGILSVCIGVGPIGFFLIGVLGDAIGARQATAGMAVAGFISLVVTWTMWKGMMVRTT